ncbi:MAG: tRNA preQ1(34) S-adenosylmethionine ribosyltransferase-isomerase QueA [Gammaproteobacteria bacterium]|nr:tRNA preQ1(34) S-adenosylmethionine ribosyltransferase-isomerase QueA [Gammaproteobacteria bacterium]
MNLQDFDYKLPTNLIAQFPTTKRTASKLLVLNKDTGEIIHQQFKNLGKFLLPNDLLVFNDTKVIPARLFGQKVTGGKVEVLFERIISDHTFLAQIRASKPAKIGTKILIQQYTCEVLTKNAEFYTLRLLDKISLHTFLEQNGQIPLPPYIDRAPTDLDNERYQTVYAKYPGAVAAPTAGLHFDKPLLDQIQITGAKIAFVTLHVGAGTFQPVRVTDITKHQMHTESVTVPEDTCELIRETKKFAGRIIAVGTTCVRSLESAAKNGAIEPLYNSDTNIFIYPGYKFQIVDAIITNFHLPKSTLLMLVSAFAGREKIYNAYQIAIQNQYRFFSYGDAMFIKNN